MNILIYNWRDTKHSWAGGSEIYIQEIAKRWAKEGNNVTLFCGQDPFKPLPSQEKVDGIYVYRKGGRFSVYFWAFIYYFKYFRKKVDIVVDVENGVPFFTPFYSRKKKICLVYHVHDTQFFYELSFPFNIVGYLLEKYMFPFIYGNMPIIAISESTKKDLTKLGFNPKKISIINPGVSKSNFDIKNIVKFKKPTLLYLGRIKKYKRLSLLIEILPEILKKNSNVRLIIAGWGSEAPIISDVIMKSKNRRNIDIMGPVSEQEKKYLLSKSWVFINPSLHEGWGISITEANLYGTPAVAFSVPGLSDAIIHKSTGLLAENKEEMVNYINEMVANNELRDKMSKEAYKRASLFTWEKAAEDSLAILKRVIKKKT